jgi:RimJ/RimL family protein N-acetyltransferase
MEENKKYKIFIEGEHINLSIPNSYAITHDGWADWFNETGSLSSTLYGIYPNYEENQTKILDGLFFDKTKIVLLITNKENSKAIGVISLQSINLQNSSAEIALNVTSKARSLNSSLMSLEAMALMTEHGFEQVGLIRIYAGQVFPDLLNWNRLLEIIGYKTEGILRNSFKRGHQYLDTMMIACHYEDYCSIRRVRGSLWDDVKKIKERLRKQPKESFAERLDTKLSEMNDEYFDFLK